jgi:hypothetical protein
VSEKKRTGLGANAFFKQNQPADDQSSTGEPASPRTDKATQPAVPPKPKKVRTTVTMYENTLASMEFLKIEARKQGIKATLSDILEEAITTLMEKKKLQLK